MKYSQNASRLVELFGGLEAMSQATGIHKSAISRWTSDGSPRQAVPRKPSGDPRYRRDARAGHGHVPARYNEAIMRAATEAGFPARAKVHLEWNCPTCGQKLKSAS
jgi:hypothetical protein